MCTGLGVRMVRVGSLDRLRSSSIRSVLVLYVFLFRFSFGFSTLMLYISVLCLESMKYNMSKS